MPMACSFWENLTLCWLGNAEHGLSHGWFRMSERNGHWHRIGIALACLIKIVSHSGIVIVVLFDLLIDQSQQCLFYVIQNIHPSQYWRWMLTSTIASLPICGKNMASQLPVLTNYMTNLNIVHCIAEFILKMSRDSRIQPNTLWEITKSPTHYLREFLAAVRGIM